MTPYRYERPVLCKNVARFKARVSQVRTVKKGELVGYDDDHPLPEDRVIATISAGYVDGFPRLAHGQAIEIRGARAEVCGLVCMDQMMADVSHIPDAAAGDRVLLMGAEGEGRITAEDIAAWAGTISYEVLLGATGRVPREWQHATE